MRFWLLKTRWFGVEFMTRSKANSDFHGHQGSALMLFPGTFVEEVEHNYEYTTAKRRWLFNLVPYHVRHRISPIPWFMVGFVRFRRRRNSRDSV